MTTKTDIAGKHATGPSRSRRRILATPPGGHDFALGEQALADSLPWISWQLKLTRQPQSVPAHCPPGQS